jgi:hypothetical protein
MYNWGLCILCLAVIGLVLYGAVVVSGDEGMTGSGATPLKYTSCTQASGTDCATCTNAYIQSAGNICYWNKTDKKCGSFPDDGYTKNCDAPTPTPTPTPTVFSQCKDITDCNTCATDITQKDGVCYWCNDKCTSGDNYTSDCSRDPMKCSGNTSIAKKLAALHHKQSTGDGTQS